MPAEHGPSDGFGRFQITPPGPDDLSVAYAAFLTFGKSRFHPAAPNFGALVSHALAKARNLPQLYNGNDFEETDIRSALSGGARPARRGDPPLAWAADPVFIDPTSVYHRARRETPTHAITGPP